MKLFPVGRLLLVSNDLPLAIVQQALVCERTAFLGSEVRGRRGGRYQVVSAEEWEENAGPDLMSFLSNQTGYCLSGEAKYVRPRRHQ
jgi:hypothetical protein